MDSSHNTFTAEETVQLGSEIGKGLSPGSVVALCGPLGSGKTTLTKGIALGIGVEDIVTSPTFTLINEYEGTIPLYHIDTYRLEEAAEFQEIGGEELFYDQGIVVVEWADKIASLLPENHVKIDISLTETGSRIITVHGADIK